MSLHFRPFTYCERSYTSDDIEYTGNRTRGSRASSAMYERKCFLNVYLTVAHLGQLKSVIPGETASTIIHFGHLICVYIVKVVSDGLPWIGHPRSFVLSKNYKKELKDFGEMDFEELEVGNFPIHYFKRFALFSLVVLVLEVGWE